MGKKLAEQADRAAKRATEAVERAEQERQAVNYQRGNQGDEADPKQKQSSTQLLVDCEIQICQTEMNEASTQVSPCIAVCYVVPELPGTK